MSLKHHIVWICLAFALCGCTKRVFVKLNEPAASSVQSIIARSIYAATGIPVYDPKMKKGDEFFYPYIPGVPIDSGELSFSYIPGDSLYSTAVEIDKAYRFAKLVNRLVKPGAQAYTDISMEQCPALIANGSYCLTSPLYDDEFLPTFINPTGAGIAVTWSSLKDKMQIARTVKQRSTSIKYTLPVYELSLEFMTLNIERPWLKHNTDFSQTVCVAGGYKYAMITKLVLARNIRLQGYSGNVMSFTISKKQVTGLQTQDPSMRMTVEGNIILGFICRII